MPIVPPLVNSPATLRIHRYNELKNVCNLSFNIHSKLIIILYIYILNFKLTDYE